jgi:hypothetical protein
MTAPISLACRCGKVRMDVEGPPIIGAECHCNSCREAGRRLEALPVVPSMVEPGGGTRFVLYRKDRLRIIDGAKLLRPFRLSPGSGTRRVVAGCCATPVFLEFKGGHWLSFYANLWPDDIRPPIEIRTQLGGPGDRLRFHDGIPAGAWATAGFYARLLGAWAAMGFRAPEAAVEGEPIDA